MICKPREQSGRLRRAAMFARRVFGRRRPDQNMRRKSLVCREEVVTAVVVGASGGGKSGLVDRLTGGQGQVDLSEDTVLQGGATQCDHHGLKVRVHVRDTSGQDNLDRLRRQSYLFANAVVLVFDTAKREVFDDLEKTWVPEIRRFCDDAPIILVGTKLPALPEADASKVSTPEVTSHVTWDDVQDVARKSRARKESDCDSGRQSPCEEERERHFYIASDSDTESLCNGERGSEFGRHRENGGKGQGCHCDGACNCASFSEHGSPDSGFGDYLHHHGHADLPRDADTVGACERREHGQSCESSTSNTRAPSGELIEEKTTGKSCVGGGHMTEIQARTQGGCRSESHGDLQRTDLLAYVRSTSSSSSEGGDAGSCRCGGKDPARVDLRKAALALGLGGRRGSLKEIFLRQKSSPAAIPRAMGDRRGSDTFLTHGARPGGRSASLRSPSSSACPRCEHLPRNRSVLSQVSRKWHSFRIPSRLRLSLHGDGDSGIDTDSESCHSREGERRRGSRFFLGRLLHRRSSSSRRGSEVVVPSTPELVSTEDLRPLSQRSVSEAEGHAMAMRIGAAAYFECSLEAGFDPEAILSAVVSEHFKLRKSKIGLLCKLKRAMSA